LRYFDRLEVSDALAGEWVVQAVSRPEGRSSRKTRYRRSPLIHPDSNRWTVEIVESSFV
jgi:hypothetical protein